MSLERARAYAHAFDNLSPETLDDLRALVHVDVVFKDPFNETRGADDLIGLLRKMFEDTDQPKFVTHQVMAEGSTGLIKWQFRCGVRVFGELRFEGVSEVAFDDDGLLIRHIDYWDASEHVYQRLPLLGWAIGLVRKRLAYRR